MFFTEQVGDQKNNAFKVRDLNLMHHSNNRSTQLSVPELKRVKNVIVCRTQEALDG